MKQWFFLVVLIVLVVLAMNRPVYSMPVMFDSANDMEHVLGWSSCNNVRNLTTEEAHSGTHSSKVEPKYAASYIFNVLATQLPKPEVKMLRVKAWVYTNSDNAVLEIVCKAYAGDKPPFIYRAAPAETEKGKWVLVEHDFDILWNFNGLDEISTFFLNESDSAVVYVDDMQVSVY